MYSRLCLLLAVSAATQAVHASARTPPVQAPDNGEWIVLQGGDRAGAQPVAVSARVSGCGIRNGLAECNLTALRVEVDGTPVPVVGAQARITYVVPGGGYSAGASVPLTVRDINADGHSDLQVWQTSNGNYNAPRHAFYLFNAQTGRFERALALEAAIGGREIDEIAGGQVTLWGRPSPCEREQKQVQVRGSEVTTVFQRSYDTCKGEAPPE